MPKLSTISAALMAIIALGAASGAAPAEPGAARQLRAPGPKLIDPQAIVIPGQKAQVDAVGALVAAGSVSPDAAAKVQQNATRVNAPISYDQAYADALRISRQGSDARGHLQGTPALTSILTDADVATVAQDSTQGLSWRERLIRNFRGLAERGIPDGEVIDWPSPLGLVAGIPIMATLSFLMWKNRRQLVQQGRRVRPDGLAGAVSFVLGTALMFYGLIIEQYDRTLDVIAGGILLGVGLCLHAIRTWRAKGTTNG